MTDSSPLVVGDGSHGDEHSASDGMANFDGTCHLDDVTTDKVVFSQINGDDSLYVIPKSASIDSVSSSMQNSHPVVLRFQNSADLPVRSTEDNCVFKTTENTHDESASFSRLSRRESSLENLAEDVTTDVHFTTASIIPESVNVTPNSKLNTKKSPSSSRVRRTLSSLFTCCTIRSRRSNLTSKSDFPTESGCTTESEKLSNLSVKRATENDPHISLNCLKLRKFLDIFDEPDTASKRMQQKMTRTVVMQPQSRDGEKSDSPVKSVKSSDNFQSENGGPNLTKPVLLGPLKPSDQGRKCFIIDLDETLVHSSFKMVEKADFKVGVEIEGTVHTVYVLKRPYVDVFLQKMGRIFECVLFTASLAKYADPVADFLDKWRVFRWRLFRESCVFHRGNYVKDLDMLGRQPDQVAILDNSPASYMFHPDHAVQITSWFDDPRDTALLDLIPYFEQLAASQSVPAFLATHKPPPRATVPVSVMLLPLAAPSSTSNTFQQQQQHSSSYAQSSVAAPITAVSPPPNYPLIQTPITANGNPPSCTGNGNDDDIDPDRIFSPSCRMQPAASLPHLNDDRLPLPADARSSRSEGDLSSALLLPVTVLVTPTSTMRSPATGLRLHAIHRSNSTPTSLLDSCSSPQSLKSPGIKAFPSLPVLSSPLSPPTAATYRVSRSSKAADCTSRLTRSVSMRVQCSDRPYARDLPNRVSLRIPLCR